MGYRLRNGLSFCVTGQRAIFLDVAADRYFGLQPQWDLVFRRLVMGEAPGSDLGHLVASAILVEDEEIDSPPQPVSIPCASREVPLDPATGSMGQRFAFIRAQISAIIRLRVREFGLVIAQIERRARCVEIDHAGRADPEWTGWASAFAASSWLLPQRGQCLPRSIAFLKVLLAAGLSAKLVIGVSASPFSAHCWVQADDMVLNDRLENIRPFEPILAI